MGKDQKLRSDPTRAREHAVGTPVNVIQVLTHSQLGAISYFWPRHWMFHAHAAETAANQLAGWLSRSKRENLGMMQQDRPILHLLREGN